MIIKGILLGLSTGIFCLSWCVPIYTPLLLSTPKSKKEIWLAFLKFSLGRLIAYLLFGLVVGYLSSFLTSLIVSQVISWAIVILAILMIFYALGLTVPKSKFCHVFKKTKVLFWAGFLTGINVCPPFLLAVTSGLKTGEVISGALYFFAFFIGTSVYLIPITFLGYFSKLKLLNQIATYSAILVGLIFLIYGLKGI
jgi:sulfite exporter TauE/SafE